MKNHNKLRDLARAGFKPKSWAPQPVLLHLCKEPDFRRYKQESHTQQQPSCLYSFTPMASPPLGGAGAAMVL